MMADCLEELGATIRSIGTLDYQPSPEDQMDCGRQGVYEGALQAFIQFQPAIRELGYEPFQTISSRLNDCPLERLKIIRD